jgi:tetratricopeptide (TPR) repeat protein
VTKKRGKMAKDDLSEKLRGLRKRSGLKLKILSLRSKCYISDLSRYENGERKPSKETLIRIINVYKEYFDSNELDILFDLAGYRQDSLASEKQSAEDFNLEHIRMEIDNIKSVEDKTIILNQVDKLITMYTEVFLINDLLKERNWIEGSEHIENLERRINQIQLLNAYFFEAKSIAMYSRGFYEQAIESNLAAYQSMKNYSESLNNPSEIREADQRIGNTLINLGDVYRRKSSWDNALSYYSQSMEIFGRYNDIDAKKAVGNLRRKKGGVYNYQGLVNDAIRELDASLDCFTEINDLNGTYKTKQHFGWSYRLCGKWDDAVNLCKESLNIANQTGDKYDQMKAYTYLGESLLLVNKKEEANKAYEYAEKIKEEIKISGREAKLQEGTLYLGLGKVYSQDLNQKERALEKLKQSFTIHNELGEDFWIGVNYIDLGTLMLENTYGNSDAVVFSILTKAVDLFKHLHIPLFELGALINLCTYYYQKRDYQKVFSIQSIANEIPDDGNGTMNRPRSYIDWIVGKSFLMQGNFNEAIEAIVSSLLKAINYNDYVFCDIIKLFSEECINLSHNKENIPLVKSVISEFPWNIIHDSKISKWEIINNSKRKLDDTKEKINATYPQKVEL